MGRRGNPNKKAACSPVRPPPPPPPNTPVDNNSNNGAPIPVVINTTSADRPPVVDSIIPSLVPYESTPPQDSGLIETPTPSPLLTPDRLADIEAEIAAENLRVEEILASRSPSPPIRPPPAKKAKKRTDWNAFFNIEDTTPPVPPELLASVKPNVSTEPSIVSVAAELAGITNAGQPVSPSLLQQPNGGNLVARSRSVPAVRPACLSLNSGNSVHSHSAPQSSTSEGGRTHSCPPPSRTQLPASKKQKENVQPEPKPKKQPKGGKKKNTNGLKVNIEVADRLRDFRCTPQQVTPVSMKCCPGSWVKPVRRFFIEGENSFIIEVYTEVPKGVLIKRYVGKPYEKSVVLGVESFKALFAACNLLLEHSDRIDTESRKGIPDVDAFTIELGSSQKAYISSIPYKGRSKVHLGNESYMAIMRMLDTRENIPQDEIHGMVLTRAFLQDLHERIGSLVVELL